MATTVGGISTALAGYASSAEKRTGKGFPGTTKEVWAASFSPEEILLALKIVAR